MKNNIIFYNCMHKFNYTVENIWLSTDMITKLDFLGGQKTD